MRLKLYNIPRCDTISVVQDGIPIPFRWEDDETIIVADCFERAEIVVQLRRHIMAEVARYGLLDMQVCVPQENPLSLEAFADWCEAQGDRSYNWFVFEHCACSQYAAFLGMKYSSNPVFQNMNFQRLAMRKPWTFPALAQRLREAAQ